jgi:hypothetical protein
MTSRRAQVVALALRHAVPTIYAHPVCIANGGNRRNLVIRVTTRRQPDLTRRGPCGELVLLPEAVEKRAIGVDDALRLAAMEVEAAVNRLARLA